MSHLLPGLSGIAVGLVTLVLAGLAADVTTKGAAFHFDAEGEKGAFEKLLPVYLRLAEFILGLAAGSIVLLVGSSAFRAAGRLPQIFASPFFDRHALGVRGICAVQATDRLSQFLDVARIFDRPY